MTKEEFVAQIERGAAVTPALPVTTAILRWTAEQLKRGEPGWWRQIAKAWEKRRFVDWTEAWTLYVTALHFEALNDGDCPLVPFFPSCGGTAEAEAGPGLGRFMSDLPNSFLENLRTRHRRTYVPWRAELWIWPATVFFTVDRALPFYLVEVNAGAGLHLASDILMPREAFDSALIQARIGLDPQPLDLSDIAHRRWLTAGIWPDYLQGITELDAAIETVQRSARREANFLQMVECPPEKAPAFIAKNIPADDPEVGLMILNMGTTSRMTDAEYAAYAAAIAETLKPWGDRGLWIEAEGVRGETYSSTLQLRGHRLVDGQPRSLVLAKVDMDKSKVDMSEAAPAFLKNKPVAPPPPK